MERLLFRPDKYAFDPQALLYFVAALIILYCGFIVLRRIGPSRTRELVLVTTGVLLVWSCARAAARLATDPEYVLFWYRLAWFMIPLALALMFHHVMYAIGMAEKRQRLIGVVWLGALCFAFIPLFWKQIYIVGIAQFPWGYEPVHGPLATVMVVLVAMLSARAVADMLARLRTVPAGTDERRRIHGISVSMVCLMFSFTDFLSAEGLWLYPLGVVAVPGFFFGITLVTTRWGLVDISTEIAGGRIIDLVNLPILVVDCDGSIRVANDAACAALDEKRPLLIGTNMAHLFQKMPALRKFVQSDDGAGLTNVTLTRLQHHQERDYEMRATAQMNSKNEPQAYICLLRDLTQERHEEQERIEASLRDPLTGLPGRQTFLEYVELAVRDVARGRTPCGVLFISIDRFRNVNEEISFSAGDEVLVWLARRLSLILGTRDIVARVGGDEFAVLLESGYRDDVMQADAEKIQQQCSQPLEVEGRTLHLALSIGAAMPSQEGGGAVAQMRNAAVAMHAAKKAGGAQICIYDGAKHSDSGEIALETQIREGVERNEFIPFYQPIFDLKKGKIVGFEALARWQHRDRGLVGAYEFIEFAEESGLISEITRSMQAQVFADMRTLNKEVSGTRPYVSLNISDCDFRKPDFVEDFHRQVADAGLESAQICLEITERMVMLNPGDERLDTLSKYGYRLFIDDFGTGYSSMTRLHTLPLHTLKIDRQFVLAMGKSESGERLIEGIINLANSLGLNIVAEGVGEAHEAEKLRQFQCPYVQGFHFGKPMPFEEAREAYRKSGLKQH